MSWISTAVIRKQKQWTVQVESTSGESAELTYPSEAQARYFAAVLALRPSTLPKAAITKRLAELSPLPRGERETATSGARATSPRAQSPLGPH